MTMISDNGEQKLKVSQQLKCLVHSDMFASEMVRSTEAARLLLKVWEDLAPLRHMIDDLRREKEILQRSQPIVELYGCFHLSDSCDARRL